MSKSEEETKEIKPNLYKKNWCVAKSSQTFLTEKKPVNKMKINLPCPGYLKKTCSSNSEPHEWRCLKCGFYIEFAPKSEYFYCLCGAALTNSYSFKCSNLNHGNEFMEFDENDLKLYLEKCLNEIKQNK